MTAKITFVVFIIGTFFSGITLAHAPSRSFGELFVGFSEKDITPNEPKSLAGYGTSFLSESLVRLSEGVHDPLKAGAIALKTPLHKTVVLVSIDAVGVSPQMIERIRKASRSCVDADIFISATHTHHAPDVVGLWGALPKSGRDDAYMKVFESKILSAVCEASSRMQEAKLYIGESELEPVSSSEENDTHLTFLKFDNLKGETLGTLTQWNAHPTTMTAKNRMVSADFPGAFRNIMNSKTPKAVHLYFSGTLGGTYVSQDLETSDDIFPDAPRSLGEDVENYRRMSAQGKRIVDKVSQLKLKLLKPTEIKTQVTSIGVPNNNFIFGLAFALRILEKRPESVKIGNSDQITTQIGLLTLGDLAIATVPGEVFPGVSNEIREILSSKGFKNTMILGITNDWLGYIMHPKNYRDEEMKYYRSLSLGSELGQKILESFQDLSQENEFHFSRLPKS